MLSVAGLIDGLGGGVVVARKMRVTPSAVSHWRTAGKVPSDRHLAMWRLAVEDGLDWTPPGMTGLALVSCSESAEFQAVAA